MTYSSTLKRMPDGVTSQKTALFKITAMGTSNPAQNVLVLIKNKSCLIKLNLKE
jgi:hypothetical protein